MILDERSEFCDATALDTGGTGRTLVGDVMDLGAVAPGDIGNGQPLYLVVQVTTDVTSAGAATVSFELASDAAAAIATDGSATEHVVTEAIGKADLVAGYTRVFPVGLVAAERYLGILQNVGVAALTAGAVNAFLTADPHGWSAQPNAI